MRPLATLLGCLALLPVSGIGKGSEPDVRKLISDLGDRSFAIREAAQKRLAKDEGAPLEELLTALDTARDEEIRLRLSEVVAAKRFPAALVEILTLSDGQEPVLVLGQKLLTPETERLKDGESFEQCCEDGYLGSAPGSKLDHNLRAFGIGTQRELVHPPSRITSFNEAVGPLAPPFRPAPFMVSHRVVVTRDARGIDVVEFRECSANFMCGHYARVSLSPPRRGPVYAALDDILIRVEGISLAQAEAVKPLVCDPGHYARRTRELREEIAAQLARGTLPVRPPAKADSGHADYSRTTVLAAAAFILKDPSLTDAIRKSLAELLAIDPEEDKPFTRRWERDLLCLAETLCDLGDPRDAPLLAELPGVSSDMGGLVVDASARYLSRVGLKNGNVLAAALLQCHHPAGSRLADCRSLAESARVPLPEPLVCDQMVIALCDTLKLPHGDYRLSRFEEILLKDAKAVPDDVWPRIEAARLRRDRNDCTWIYASGADRTEGIARMLKTLETGGR